jgi:hypothetical protein
VRLRHGRDGPGARSQDSAKLCQALPSQCSSTSWRQTQATDPREYKTSPDNRDPDNRDPDNKDPDNRDNAK